MLAVHHALVLSKDQNQARYAARRGHILPAYCMALGFEWCCPWLGRHHGLTSIFLNQNATAGALHLDGIAVRADTTLLIKMSSQGQASGTK